jgi:hypothetical protein
MLDVAVRPEAIRSGVVAFVEQREGFEHECLVQFG